MHAKVVTIDISGDGHGLEALDEQLVDLFVVELLKDLGAEGEMLSHGSRLVIASKHDNVTWVVQLEAEKEDADFKGEDAAIDVITEEEQVCGGDALGVDDLLKHVDHVVELSMNVTNDDHGLLYADHVWLVTYPYCKTRWSDTLLEQFWLWRSFFSAN